MIKLNHSLWCKWYWFKILTFSNTWSYSWKGCCRIPIGWRRPSHTTSNVMDPEHFRHWLLFWAEQQLNQSLLTSANERHLCFCCFAALVLHLVPRFPWLRIFSPHRKVSASRWKLTCGRLCAFRFSEKVATVPFHILVCHKT